MDYVIAEMTLERYDELIEFWHGMGGIYHSDDDKYDNLKIYLERNPGTNFIVLDNDQIIATIKCSHDGRKGYIHRVAVDPRYRKKGIARELVYRCLELLQEKGIKQVRLFVLDSNTEALRFWKYIGFEERIYNYRTFQLSLDDK